MPQHKFLLLKLLKCPVLIFIASALFFLEKKGMSQNYLTSIVGIAKLLLRLEHSFKSIKGINGYILMGVGLHLNYVGFTTSF